MKTSDPGMQYDSSIATAATFCTVSNASFFPGTVALLNSLRLTGNLEELIVLDTGLTGEQRARLGEHVTLVDVPAEFAQNPYLIKAYPYGFGTTGSLILIDSDMIVTASLGAMIAPAESGKICVFVDQRPDDRRWFGEWKEAFELEAALRRQPYVNAGFVAFDLAYWPHLLNRWWSACLRIPHASGQGPLAPHYEQLDQDALNAILMSEISSEAICVLPEVAEVYPNRLYRVQVKNAATLECTLDGAPVSILHQSLRPKVWSASGWRRTGNAYAQLMSRLLHGDDLLLRLETHETAWWLHPGVPRLSVGAAVGGAKQLSRISWRVMSALR